MIHRFPTFIFLGFEDKGDRWTWVAHLIVHLFLLFMALLSWSPFSSKLKMSAHQVSITELPCKVFQLNKGDWFSTLKIYLYQSLTNVNSLWCLMISKVPNLGYLNTMISSLMGSLGWRGFILRVQTSISSRFVTTRWKLKLV